MRRLAYPAAILLLVTSAVTAYAGAGLPKLASFTVGTYKVGVHVDSLVPRVGTNVLTVEAASLPHGAQVELKLVGPGGQTVEVPLNPLTVLSGPDGGHGDDHGAPAADSHGAAADSHGTTTDSHGTAANSHGTPDNSHGTPADSHGTPANSHGTPANSHGTPSNSHDTAAASDHEHAAESEALNARGKVKLDQTGNWTAVLQIHGTPEGDLHAEAPFTVENGGPSRPYLAFTGLLMGGTAIYAAINRRKGADTGR